MVNLYDCNLIHAMMSEVKFEDLSLVLRKHICFANQARNGTDKQTSDQTLGKGSNFCAFGNGWIGTTGLPDRSEWEC